METQIENYSSRSLPKQKRSLMENLDGAQILENVKLGTFLSCM